MKIHKLSAYVIYDLYSNIYLGTVKGNFKSAKGFSNESSFLTGEKRKRKEKALTLKHTIPLQMLF